MSKKSEEAGTKKSSRKGSKYDPKVSLGHLEFAQAIKIAVKTKIKETKKD